MHLLINSMQSGNTAFASDQQTVDVLRDRQHNDSNNYVRLQSATALRELNAQ